jgi:integrase/recombinase XerD
MTDYGRDWESLAAGFRSWLQFERNMAKHTVAAYTHDVELFRSFVAREWGDMLPAEVDGAHVEAFMAEIYDRGMEATSQARMLSSVTSFYKFLQDAEIVDRSPTEFVDAPKTARHLPDVLSTGEIDRMLATIDLASEQGHRNRAMLETLYSCGLRVSELVDLRLGDLFFDDGFVRVTGKGSKQRLVPVSGEARRRIEQWLEQRRAMTVDAKSAEVVFLNRRGRRLSRVMVFNIIKTAAAAAGIDKQVSPHTLRHSFATHLLEGGASIRQVQEMLGHESIITTEIYTHLDRTRLRHSVEKHHPLG